MRSLNDYMKDVDTETLKIGIQGWPGNARYLGEIGSIRFVTMDSALESVVVCAEQDFAKIKSLMDTKRGGDDVIEKRTN